MKLNKKQREFKAFLDTIGCTQKSIPLWVVDEFFSLKAIGKNFLNKEVN